MTDDPYRLPRTVLPTRYDLVLEPDLAAAAFSGRVDITLDVVEPVDRLVLNADELGIVAVRVNGTPVGSHHLDAATERLVVDHALTPGAATLTIEFTGTLNDKLRGWYRSTFRDADGNERVIATSQMQATDCRRAFPCWDEPDFKAVFAVTLVVEPHLVAISNGAEVERAQQADGKHAVRFADTMPMSTYLVAFVVGPLAVTEPVQVPLLGDDTRTIPLRIVHVPGKEHLTEFGLRTGEFALGWYQQYYGLPYPTDKCDMIALPDFAAGAMENLGCITYRENLLLADPATSTLAELQTIADVITHELAHMWFGDLVTMRWWNGIWLNEAFATFMEVACCDAYRPDWQRWTSFGLERSMAFEVDSLASTRAVEFPVFAPADCDGMFDVLTYQKGGALLRMLEQYLGVEAFRSGVNHYLRTHAHANTETGDLWDAIEAMNPGTPVRRMMDSWIWQPGYPLVLARLDGSDLVLSQQRFAFGSTDDPTLWVVPVHLRNGGTEQRVLLDGDTVRVRLTAPDDAVIVNAGGHGFVRVGYDAALRSRLDGAALASLSTIERYNLVDDAWNECVAGRLDATGLLALLEGFSGERDLAVWQAVALALRGLGRLVDGDAHTAFRVRVHALASPALDALGWEPTPGEDDLTGKLRGLLVGLVAVLGDDADAQARCRAIFDAPEGVHPELVAAATTVVAAVGGEEEYERLLHGFRHGTTPQEQLRHLYTLADLPDAALVQRVCELALSDEVKTMNAPFLLQRCIANRDHGVQAWQFVRQHWDAINDRFPASLIVRIADPAKLLNTPEVVADVQAFFSEHPIAQSAKTLDQVLERQRVNAALRARDEAPLTVALLG